ncbi:luciferin sulfotransferase-like [Scylla paramamosain]|uniref:luciferin sulfotransferase-like n=1 Tax=Scylla paramamosain TaxID=85552 RepID=UPI0030837FF2
MGNYLLSLVVYVARNPKDVCLSTYNIYTSMERFTGDLSDWVELFTGDSVIYGPYWKHLKQAWHRRNHLNLHFMFYEDMKTDIMNELRKLNTFLKLGLSDEQLLRASENSSVFEKERVDKKFVIKEILDFVKFSKEVIGKTLYERWSLLASKDSSSCKELSKVFETVSRSEGTENKVEKGYRTRRTSSIKVTSPRCVVRAPGLTCNAVDACSTCSMLK